MVLTFTGSIAELKPFTAQIIQEMKENISGFDTNRVTLLENELRRAYNILFFIGSIWIPVVRGTPPTLVGSIEIKTRVNQGFGSPQFFGFNEPVQAFQFTW